MKLFKKIICSIKGHKEVQSLMYPELTWCKICGEILHTADKLGLWDKGEKNYDTWTSQ